MLLFWLIISVMILIAIAFVSLPLLRKRTTRDISQHEAMRVIYQGHLQELQEQYQQGLLIKQQLSVEKEELTHNLLRDLSDKKLIDTEVINDRKKNIITAIFFVFVIPILAIWLYLQWGNSVGVAEQLATKNNAQEVQQELAQYHNNPQQIISRMKEILLHRSKSAQGWYLLGRLYVSQGQFSQAVSAFREANQLQPQQPMIMLQYAESLFFANEEKLSPQATQLLKQVLIKMPNSLDAMNLLAMDAYNKHDYSAAIHYWELILNYLSPTSNDGKAVLRAIAAAQNAYKLSL